MFLSFVDENEISSFSLLFGGGEQKMKGPIVHEYDWFVFLTSDSIKSNILYK